MRQPPDFPLAPLTEADLVALKIDRAFLWENGITPIALHRLLTELDRRFAGLPPRNPEGKTP